MKDDGLYTCKAVNSAGEAKCSATVKVDSKLPLFNIDTPFEYTIF